MKNPFELALNKFISNLCVIIIIIVEELNPKQIRCYQGIIGTLRWICELGHIDILMPTNLMTSHMMCPKKEHLE